MGLPSASPDAPVALVHLAYAVQQQRYRMVRNVLLAVVRHICQQDALAFHRCCVHVVDADPVACHAATPAHGGNHRLRDRRQVHEQPVDLGDSLGQHGLVHSRFDDDFGIDLSQSRTFLVVAGVTVVGNRSRAVA